MQKTLENEKYSVYINEHKELAIVDKSTTRGYFFDESEAKELFQFIGHELNLFRPSYAPPAPIPYKEKIGDKWHFVDYTTTSSEECRSKY